MYDESKTQTGNILVMLSVVIQMKSGIDVKREEEMSHRRARSSNTGRMEEHAGLKSKLQMYRVRLASLLQKLCV